MHGYSALSNGIINGGCENENTKMKKFLAVVLSAALVADWQQVAEAKKTVKKKIKEAARKRRK